MGTIAVPGRSLEQRLSALQNANAVRTYRAGLKREIAAGKIRVTELYDDPNCRTMRVYEALICVPKVGRVRANKAFRACSISHSKTFGGLTYRQRDELAAWMRVR